jgi:hypothetical protein
MPHGEIEIFRSTGSSRKYIQYCILYKKSINRNSNKRRLDYSFIIRPAYEGPVRIHHKCMILIYVFPEMKLRSLVNYKTEL